MLFSFTGPYEGNALRGGELSLLSSPRASSRFLPSPPKKKPGAWYAGYLTRAAERTQPAQQALGSRAQEKTGGRGGDTRVSLGRTRSVFRTLLPCACYAGQREPADRWTPSSRCQAPGLKGIITAGSHMGQRVQLQVYLCLRERLFTLYPRTIIQNLRSTGLGYFFPECLSPFMI